MDGITEQKEELRIKHQNEYYLYVTLVLKCLIYSLQISDFVVRNVILQHIFKIVFEMSYIEIFSLI